MLTTWEFVMFWY